MKIKTKKKELISDEEEIIKFLNIIYRLRENAFEKYFKSFNNIDKTNIISNLSKLLNFFEGYSPELIKIIHIFIKISQRINDLYEQIERIITKKETILEISNINPKYSLIVNESFYIAIDSILRVIITNENIYNNLKDKNSDENIFNIFNTFKEVLQSVLSLSNELYFKSQEVISLQEIVKLLETLNNINMLNINNFRYIMIYFKDESRYINEK